MPSSARRLSCLGWLRRGPGTCAQKRLFAGFIVPKRQRQASRTQRPQTPALLSPSELGAAVRIASQGPGARDLRRWRGLSEATLLHAGELPPKQLAFVTNGFARARVPDREVFRRLADRALEQLELFEPREVALLLNAYAKLEFRDVELFETFARHICGQPPDGFGEQQLALVANAYARLAILDMPLFQRLSGWVVNAATEFSAQGVATVVNAYAKALIRDDVLLNAMDVQAQRRLSELRPQHVANILHAYARLEAPEAGVLRPLADKVAACARDFGPLELAAAAHGLVKLGLHQRRALTAIAETAKSRSGELRARQLAGVLHAFSTLTTTYGRLFEDLGPSVLASVGGADDGSVVLLLGAYARAGQPHGRVVQALLTRLGECAEALELRGLVQALYACGRLGLRREPEVRRLASAVLERAGELPARHVANCLYALARLGPEAEELAALLRGLQARLLPGAGLRFDQQQLANAMHALAALHGTQAAPVHALPPLPGAAVAALVAQAQHHDWAAQPQLLASIAVSCAHLQHSSAPLFALVSRTLRTTRCTLPAQGLVGLLSAFAVVHLFDLDLFSWVLGKLSVATTPLAVLLDAVAVLDFLSCSLPAAARASGRPETAPMAVALLFPECPPHFRAQASELYGAAGLALLASSPRLPAAALQQAAPAFARAGLLAAPPFDLLTPCARAGALAAASEAPRVPLHVVDAAKAAEAAEITEASERDGAGHVAVGEGTALDWLLGELSTGVASGVEGAEGLAQRLARYTALLRRAEGRGPAVPPEVLDELIAAMGQQLAVQAAILPFADITAALATLADAAVRPRAVVEALVAAAEMHFPPSPQAGTRGPHDTACVAELCRALSALEWALAPGLQVRLVDFVGDLAESLARALAPEPQGTAPPVRPEVRRPLGQQPLMTVASLVASLRAAGALKPGVLRALLHGALVQSGLAGQYLDSSHGALAAAARGARQDAACAPLEDLTCFLAVLLPLVTSRSEVARDIGTQSDGPPVDDLVAYAIAESTSMISQVLEPPLQSTGADPADGVTGVATATPSPAQLLQLVQVLGVAPAYFLGAPCQHFLASLVDCLLRSKQALGPSGLSSCLHSFTELRLLQNLDVAPLPGPEVGAAGRLARRLAALLRAVLAWSRRLSLAEAARAAHACALSLDARALSEVERAEARAGLAQLLEQLCWERQRWAPEERRLVAAVGVLLRSEFPELLRGAWLSRAALAELEELRRAGRGGLALVASA